MTIAEIFARANTMCNDNFRDLASIVGYLNDAQDIIANFDPVRAEPYNTLVVDKSIMLPSDLLRLHKILIDGIEYTPTTEPWGGVIVDQNLTDGAAVQILYFCTPPTLQAEAEYQEPRVPRKYHSAMAAYAAKMFYQSDDDPALREAYNETFRSSLAQLKTTDGVAKRFSNYL